MLCFFFKQKTAYEMRISDWSSDGCSSDLQEADRHGVGDVGARPPHTAGARAEEVGEDVVGADVVAEVEGAVLAAGAAARAGLVAVEAALPRRLLSAGVDLAAVEALKIGRAHV